MAKSFAAFEVAVLLVVGLAWAKSPAVMEKHIAAA